MEFISITGENLNEDYQKTVEFHGHECPGVTIGYRVSKYVLDHYPRSEDEQLVAIVENNSCSIDGIQQMLGCTFGKGNLIFKDRGKQAFTFFVRDTGEGVRIVLKDLPRREDREKRTKELLKMNVEDMFEFQAPRDEIPKRARIYPSLKCEICGEKASERNMRIKEGKIVCMDCFEKD